MSTLLKVPPITTDQFLAFKAPIGFREELIRGEIILSPDPKPIHHDVVEQIFLLLRDCLLQHPYKVGSRVNIKLDRENSMPSPDVFVLTRAEWTDARRMNRYPTVCPILAIEVVSPANRKKRILQKTDLYLANGSKAVWIVYPKSRKVEVFCVEESRPTVYWEGESINLPPPLPRSSLAVNDILVDENS